MPTILIRDMPEEVHASLKAQAHKNRRSAEKQALYLIETSLQRRPPTEHVLAAARKLHARCAGTATLKEILQATEADH